MRTEQIEEYFRIYENGTLEIISTRLRDQGEYTCSASNSVLPHLSRSVQVQLNGRIQYLDIYTEGDPERIELLRSLHEIDSIFSSYSWFHVFVECFIISLM